MKLIDFFVEYFDVISAIMSVVAFVFVLWMKSRFATKEEHDKLKEAYAETVKRVDHNQMRIDQMPDAAAIQSLIIQITKFEGEIKSVLTRFEGLAVLMERMQSQADRMEDFLKAKM